MTAATEHARTVAAGDFSWRELERTAFAGHDAVLRAIDDAVRDREVAESNPVPRRRVALFWLWAVGVFAPLVIPGILLVGARGSGTGTSVALAIAAALAVYNIVVRIAEWSSAERRATASSARDIVLASVSAVFGAIAVLLAWAVGIADDSALAWPSLWVFAAMTIVSIAAAIDSARRHGGARARVETPYMVVDRTVAEIPSGERAKISSDLRAAIEILEERQVIGRRDAQEASVLALGRITSWRWAIDRRKSRSAHAPA